MKTSILVVLCFGIAAVASETALKVKWGVPLINSDIFIEIPRDEADIVSKGWELISRPSDAPLQALKMYCSIGDVTFCPMYDDTNYIAGLQIALAKEEFTENPFDLAGVGFSTWTHDGVEYWTNQQYFVSEDSLNLTADEREKSRSAADYPTLAEGALWLVGTDGNLLKVSTVESEIADSIFTKQACVVSMGIHYYYNMSSEIDCSALYPWFTLVSSEELIGTGFMAFGTYPDPTGSKSMWFERPPRAAVQFIVPHGPQCLYDLSSSPGVITMHIYYTKQTPWTIGC